MPFWRICHFSTFPFELLLSHLLGLPLEERQVPMDVPKRCLTPLLTRVRIHYTYVYVRSAVTIQKTVFWFNVVNNMQLAEALRPCSNYCVVSLDRPSTILTCGEVVPIPIKWLPAVTFDHPFGNWHLDMQPHVSCQLKLFRF